MNIFHLSNQTKTRKQRAFSSDSSDSFDSFDKKGSAANTGFTLIELMVTIGIFVLLTSALMVSYVSTSADSAADIAQTRLIQTLKDARQMAKYGSELRNSGAFPSYGVELHTGNDFVEVYADCESDESGNGYVDFLDEFKPTASCPGDPIIKKVDLQNGVIIEEIIFDDNPNDANPGVSITQAHIEYIGGTHNIWISGNGTILNSGKITILLKTKRADLKRSVSVWTTGLIDQSDK